MLGYRKAATAQVREALLDSSEVTNPQVKEVLLGCSEAANSHARVDMAGFREADLDKNGQLVSSYIQATNSQVREASTSSWKIRTMCEELGPRSLAFPSSPFRLLISSPAGKENLREEEHKESQCHWVLLAGGSSQCCSPTEKTTRFGGF